MHCYGEIFQYIIANYIEVVKELKITEAEFALLRVINQLMPSKVHLLSKPSIVLANSLSDDTLKVISAAKIKYVEAFNAVVYYSNPEMDPLEIMNRVSRLMDLLSVIEV